MAAWARLLTRGVADWGRHPSFKSRGGQVSKIQTCNRQSRTSSFNFLRYSMLHSPRSSFSACKMSCRNRQCTCQGHESTLVYASGTNATPHWPEALQELACLDALRLDGGQAPRLNGHLNVGCTTARKKSEHAFRAFTEGGRSAWPLRLQPGLPWQGRAARGSTVTKAQKSQLQQLRPRQPAEQYLYTLRKAQDILMRPC